MNVLFITLINIDTINEKGIYQDLLREFVKNGHNVYIVKPTERRFKKKTHIVESDHVKILNVKTFNIQKTNIVEKGIGTILLEHQFSKAINKFFRNIDFDLILYSTPPITYVKVIKNLKKQTKAITYLLLKDIFPQNAVDLEMFSKKSLFYRYFRKKEKELYALSDYIGCMSPANVDFVLKHNAIDPKKVELCPNSIEISSGVMENEERDNILVKYSIPLDKILFIYGGNLGKPQGLDFLLTVLEANKTKKDRFFLIVGSGTEYPKIEKWFQLNKPLNAKLIESLPKKEYDILVKACDVGLIFLDPRFTIPNYPSRLLSYLENKMPVLMATDINTDIGRIAEENGYGVWTENGNLKEFNVLLDRFCNGNLSIRAMGETGYEFLKNNYTAKKTYEIITTHLSHV